tara:strand:+ start:354269 stop:354412 length:144 start_codon:yes stop_codon:yes gene_type:complete
MFIKGRGMLIGFGALVWMYIERAAFIPDFRIRFYQYGNFRESALAWR